MAGVSKAAFVFCRHVLCYAVLCCAVLCCVVLCCVVLCCVMLCCVVLRLSRTACRGCRPVADLSWSMPFHHLPPTPVMFTMAEA